MCVCPQNRPQMALLCYRKALETDAHCVSALYQSILVYRKLENTQAEIQALQLLHSVSDTNTITTLKLFRGVDMLLFKTHYIIYSILVTAHTLETDTYRCNKHIGSGVDLYISVISVPQALMLSSTAECGIAGLQLIFPSLLLCSQSLCNLLSVPSALTVLHTLAIKCVLHGRWDVLCIVVFFQLDISADEMFSF